MACLPPNAPTASVFPDDAGLRLGPNRVTILRDSWCAGGAARMFADNGSGMVAYDIAPNFVSPLALHWHTREDVAATVLDGRMAVRFADRREMVARGGTFIVPAHCPFAWLNPDGAPARIVFTYSPGGFENYFREAAALLKDDPGAGVNDMIPRLAHLFTKYGIESES